MMFSPGRSGTSSVDPISHRSRHRSPEHLKAAVPWFRLERITESVERAQQPGFRRWSAIASRISDTSDGRLLSDTNVPGHKCSRMSAFDTAFGRRSISSASRSNAFGESRTSFLALQTCRVSESNVRSSNCSRTSDQSFALCDDSTSTSPLWTAPGILMMLPRPLRSYPSCRCPVTLTRAPLRGAPPLVTTHRL